MTCTGAATFNSTVNLDGNIITPAYLGVGTLSPQAQIHVIGAAATNNDK